MNDRNGVNSTFGTKTFPITTLSIMAFGIMRLRMTTLFKMILGILIHSKTTKAF